MRASSCWSGDWDRTPPTPATIRLQAQLDPSHHTAEATLSWYGIYLSDFIT